MRKSLVNAALVAQQNETLTFPFHLIPLFQHQPPRPILPVLLDLLLLQHAECLAWEIVAVHIFGIQDVAQFVAGETVEPRIVRVQFRANVRAALLVPLERG